MVSVRLSAAEYAELEEISRANDYRSLSSFARTAILAFIPNSRSAGEQSSRDLQLRVEQLSIELKLLSERLGSMIDSSRGASF